MSDELREYQAHAHMDEITDDLDDCFNKLGILQGTDQEKFRYWVAVYNAATYLRSKGISNLDDDLRDIYGITFEHVSQRETELNFAYRTVLKVKDIEDCIAAIYTEPVSPDDEQTEVRLNREAEILSAQKLGLLGLMELLTPEDMKFLPGKFLYCWMVSLKDRPVLNLLKGIAKA